MASVAPDTAVPASRAARVAVLSCIHGNMEAFEAVLEDVRGAQVDEVVCLGDLVGYGPYPNEVVRAVERDDLFCVRGCWDEAIGLERDDCGCKFASEEDAVFGKTVFDWTARRVTARARRFLRRLPFGAARSYPGLGKVVFVHGSPRSANEYLTIATSPLVLLERAAVADCDVLVCGHTHVPFARTIEGTLRVAELDRRERRPRATTVKVRTKLLVNAGSVGEPRDGRSESSYIILDTQGARVEIRRVRYDVHRTAAAMRRRGLPAPLAERLLRGEELAVKTTTAACPC